MTTTTSALDNELKTELKEAAIWGMTLVLSRGYLDIALDTGVELNRFYNDRLLATPEHQTSGPNVETLYGFAWIDLAEGPQVLEVPDTADRYYCIQLQDACLQTVAYIGRRTTGTAAGTYILVGPDWSGELPDGIPAIELPTNLVLANTRMQVYNASDAADAAEASRLLEGFTLGPLSRYPEDRRTAIAEDKATAKRFPSLDLEAMGAGYFDRLCQILANQSPPKAEAALVQRFAAIGIRAGATPSSDPDLGPLLEPVLRQAIAEVRAVQPMIPLGESQWITSTAIRDVGPVDASLRARMNIDAPGFQCAVEGIYAALINDAENQPFDGTNSYRLHFPPGGIPPVGAFWSLTMYAMPDMRLVPNDINRYAIGSNFEDLVYQPDGSLDLYLQPHPPAAGKSNWLPTAPGPFMLLCRLYQPGEDLLEGHYSMPGAERIDR